MPATLATAAFRRWFQSSHAVDPKGRPLVLFHGTAGAFDRFSPEMVGRAHVDLEAGEVYFFTDDQKTARWYARDRATQTGQRAVVLRVYLSLQNPLVVDFQGTGIETLEEDVTRAKELGHDGLICLNYDDGGVSNHYLAFHPTQIKAADCKAFDPVDPRLSA